MMRLSEIFRQIVIISDFAGAFKNRIVPPTNGTSAFSAFSLAVIVKPLVISFPFRETTISFVVKKGNVNTNSQALPSATYSILLFILFLFIFCVCE